MQFFWWKFFHKDINKSSAIFSFKSIKPILMTIYTSFSLPRVPKWRGHHFFYKESFLCCKAVDGRGWKIIFFCMDAENTLLFYSVWLLKMHYTLKVNVKSVLPTNYMQYMYLAYECLHMSKRYVVLCRLLIFTWFYGLFGVTVCHR